MLCFMSLDHGGNRYGDGIFPEKIKPASRYKKWLEGGGGAGGLDESILQGGENPCLISVY